MKIFIRTLIFFTFSYFALIGTSVAQEECNNDQASRELNLSGQDFIDKQEYTKAFNCFLISAKKYNKAYAQSWIGFLFVNGKGVKQDYKVALGWFKLAADQGDALSQYNIGLIYGRGKGVEQDHKESNKWFRLAADQGHDRAQYALGYSYTYSRGFKKNIEEGNKWFRLSANQGYATAQYGLGLSYSKGRGVEQDHKEANKWFRLAADQGYARAQTAIGIAYYRGQGVIKDYEEAFRWNKLAADQGYDEAQTIMGYDYANGDGVVQNDEESFRWYLLAAKQGEAYAQERIGFAYRNGVGVIKNYKEAFKWYKLAADQDDKYAQSGLGYLYENGLGVQQNNKKAYEWFFLAAKQDHQYAKNHLQGLLKKDPKLKNLDITLEKKEEVKEQVVVTESIIDKKINEKEVSEIFSENKIKKERKIFILNINLEIESIDRFAKVIHKSFLRLEPNAISDRVGTMEKESSIYIAGKVKNSPYYLVNDLNGVPIGYIQIDNVDIKTLRGNKFDFGTFYALLIANDDYLNEGFQDLDTPITDAKAIESVLKSKYGFKVKTLYDATEDEIQDTISSYNQTLTENDNFLIYYAGHGYLNEFSQVGYWQGVDAKKGKSSSWVANSDITNEIKGLKAKHIIVIADSCYSGTLIVNRSSEEEITKEQKNRKDFLSKKHNKTTRVALTSGDVGEEVADSEMSSNHSPFAESFIRVLEDNTNLLYSTELHALIEKHMSLKDVEQVPLWGKIIGTGHIDGGDFPFQSIE